MNPHHIMNDDDANIVEFSENPGRRLRVQRQSRDLEIERIAAQLHLRPDIVDSLEQDRYEDLPDAVFVIGYIRNYARLLGLDPEPLIAAYRAANPDGETAAPRVSAGPGAEIGSGHILVRLISLALLVGVIAMLVLWWQDRGATFDGLLATDDTASSVDLPQAEARSGRAEPMLPATDTPPQTGTPDPTPGLMRPTIAAAPAPEETQTPTSDNRTGSGLRLPEAPTESTFASETTLSTATNTAAPEESPPESSETATSVEEPEPAQPAGPPEVSLSFSGPCWINVKDADGNAILNGEMGNGDRRVLEGAPPFDLVIGNTSVTTLMIGDKPFDLSSRSKGNVARFKLDPGNAE